MRRSTRILWLLAALTAGFMAACRAAPGLAAGWQAGIALPALRALHRATARMDGVALEAAALALPACAALALIWRRPRLLAGALLAVAAGYALLWYPGYWAQPAWAYGETEAAEARAQNEPQAAEAMVDPEAAEVRARDERQTAEAMPDPEAAEVRERDAETRPQAAAHTAEAMADPEAAEARERDESHGAEAMVDPEAKRLIELCDELIEGLKGAEARGLTAEQALARAGGVAGLVGARVKAAGHVGWMRALRVAGLFSPWTGEAVVDPGASPWLIPFTAVHELMHLQGIADEGAANVAAWRRCAAAGGAFADSARLWALRYALQALNRLDPAACLRAMERVGASLRPLCRPAADPPPLLRRACTLLGIGGAASSYGALVAWLCAE